MSAKIDWLHHESITKANFCDTCCHQFSDICGGCETLEGVPVKYSEKKTNADKIRNMTDEEMARFFDLEAFLCPWCDMSCGDAEELPCSKCMLEWLKQEAEHDNRTE